MILKDRKEGIKLKGKTFVFSFKIIAKVLNADEILVDKIKFAQMIEASDIDKAFEEAQKRITLRAAHRGYRKKNGYHFQYHLPAPIKKLWEKTAPLN